MAVDTDRGRRRSLDQRAAVRRFTVFAAVTAAGLNTILFAQSAAEQYGVGAIDRVLVSAVAAIFPSSNLQAPTETPQATSSPAVAVTGGS
jgi:hypothetical protein